MKSYKDERHERLVRKLSDIEDIDSIKSTSYGTLKTRAIQDSFWEKTDEKPEKKNFSSRLTRLLKKEKD